MNPMFSAFDIEALMAAAVEEACRLRRGTIEPVHLLVAALDQMPAEAAEQLRIDGIDLSALITAARNEAAAETGVPVEGGPTGVSSRVTRLLGAAKRIAQGARRPLHSSDILIEILEAHDPCVDRVFAKQVVPIQNLRKHLVFPHSVRPAPPVARPSLRASNSKKHPETPTLDKYGEDRTALARGGKIDPVVGRKVELKQVIRSLLRRQKCNPVLVGEAGVGKTAIVDALVLRVVSPDAPEEIRDLRVVELVMPLLAGAAKYRGEFEETLHKLVDEASRDPDLILFIDEIHVIASVSGSSMGAGDVLKPALARGAIRVVGATTPAEYRKYIERDPALERRFQPIQVDEPTAEEARAIVAGLRAALEQHHKVTIDDAALDAAVELSIRYLPDRRLPDKARDLLDQAAAACRFLTLTPGRARQSMPRVGRGDVATVVGEWTGIPIERMVEGRGSRALGLRAKLADRVVGQDDAVTAVSEVLATALAGLSDPRKPYGVFCFLGPTGVGKTELAKALAEVLFDDARHLIRIDMSEYGEKHSVSRLIGSPPGYVAHDDGGQLTNAVRRMPHCVVLLDEVEKSHTQVTDIFLQIFDDGRLTDGSGRLVDFRNTVIILTSNLGAPEVLDRRRVGYRVPQTPSEEHQPRPDPRNALLVRFRPEFVNRIGSIVEFRSLRELQIRTIIDKFADRIRQRLVEKGLTLVLAEGAHDALMRVGYSPNFGAREMERLMEKQIMSPLAQGVLRGHFPRGSTVFVLPGSEGVILSDSDG